ncbi:hypothetical protein KIN20_035890 [Parelaphostrongylus tenuis]|uniref:Uncharacterized protein n=1 Tax=Parelaphostrongylus tenuis TaxID=148309 RepID=A0AAD5RCG2_PARTN|nr:hypothetical protein KIN20_035890 [Parelaphostrongylus tenuis]
MNCVFVLLTLFMLLSAQFYRTGVYGRGSPYYPPGAYYYYIYYPYTPFNQRQRRGGFRGGLGRGFWRRLLQGAVVGGLLGFLAGKK